MRSRFYPVLQALLAAILFGASAPLSKLLLGQVQPVPLAACLYLGSGMGAFLLLLFQRIRYGGRNVEANLTRSDLPWLAGALVAGGIAAPILLLMGLQRTPASTASLLLNFESVSTTLIALSFFKESIGRRIAVAIGLVTLASILLTWTGGSWGFSLGALGVIVPPHVTSLLMSRCSSPAGKIFKPDRRFYRGINLFAIYWLLVEYS